MNKVNANFENQKVFVGLDVHKRSWNAAIFLGDHFIRNIYQPPSPQALQHFLATNYPGATAPALMKVESSAFGSNATSNKWALTVWSSTLPTYPARTRTTSIKPMPAMPMALAKP